MSASRTNTSNILDRIIRKSEGFSLNGEDLLEICENESVIVPYSRLKDVSDLAAILDEFDNFIVFSIIKITTSNILYHVHTETSSSTLRVPSDVYQIQYH